MGTTSIQAGSLEFGPDGRLSAGGTGPNIGEIHVINAANGSSTLLGATGSATGLMLIAGAAPPIDVPMLDGYGLVALCLILATGALRRRRVRA